MKVDCKVKFNAKELTIIYNALVMLHDELLERKDWRFTLDEVIEVQEAFILIKQIQTLIEPEEDDEEEE